MRWRSVPSRRSTVAASARVSARSRSGSAARPVDCAPAPSSIASSERRRRSTPSTMSAAMRRAAKPGTASGSPARNRRFPRAPHGEIAPCGRATCGFRHGYAKSEAMPTDRDQPLPPQPANEAVPDPAGKHAAARLPPRNARSPRRRPAAPSASARPPISRRKSAAATAPIRPATATGRSTASRRIFERLSRFGLERWQSVAARVSIYL